MAFTKEEAQTLMTGPIPGESLTQDPKNPQAYEGAPEYTNLEDFIDDLFLNISAEDKIDGVLDPMRKDIPVEDVAQVLLFQAMASGKINTDLMLTAVEPAIYMLLGLATFAGIDNPNLFPEDSMIDDPEDQLAQLDTTKQDKVSIDNIPVPKGISKSLVEKIQDGDL